MSSEEVMEKYSVLGLAVKLLNLLGWVMVVVSLLSLLSTLITGPVTVGSITIGAAGSGIALVAAVALSLLSQLVRVMIDMEENTRRSYRAIEELVAEIKLQNEPVLFEVEETPIDIASEDIA